MIYFFNISQYVNLTIFFCDISVIYHKFPIYYDMSIDILDLGSNETNIHTSMWGPGARKPMGPIR